jgi:hypothetical protein
MQDRERLLRKCFRVRLHVSDSEYESLYNSVRAQCAIKRLGFRCSLRQQLPSIPGKNDHNLNCKTSLAGNCPHNRMVIRTQNRTC